MIIDANAGVRGKVFDLDEQREIKGVIWCNTETGAFKAYALDAADNFITLSDGSRKVYWGKGRLKFIPADWHKGPPRCSYTGEPLASCRCDSCQGLVPTIVQKAARIRYAQFDDRCEGYGCTRFADWFVSDEMQLPPIIRNGRTYSRAKTVGIHYWCGKHYQPSKLFDHKGEIISQWETTTSRPE